MATVGIQLSEWSGTSGMKIRLRAPGAGAVVNTGGDTLTESTTTGYFTATVGETLAGLHNVDVVNSSDVVIWTGGLVNMSIDPAYVDDPTQLDGLLTVGAVASAVTLPAIPNNWITAAGITDGAFTAAKFASGAFDALWAVATSALSTAGTIGKLLVDNINATIGSRATQTKIDEMAGATFDTATDSLEAIRNRGDAAWTTGSGGGTDWTSDERTAIRTILGVPSSGTTPEAPSAGAIKVIDDLLDTEVAAIKAKTDQLTFTTTNRVDATATADVDEAAIATAIISALGGEVTVSSPVVSNAEIDIVQGTDYYTSDGRDLEFSFTGRAYTPASCKLRIASGDVITITGTVTESSGSGSGTFHAVFEIPRATGDLLQAGEGTFDVISVLSSGREVAEIAEGLARIRRRLASS